MLNDDKNDYNNSNWESDRARSAERERVCTGDAFRERCNADFPSITFYYLFLFFAFSFLFPSIYFFNILRHSFAQRARSWGYIFAGDVEHCVHHTKFYYVAKFDVNQYPAIASLTQFFFCSVSALSTSRLVSLCSTFFPNNPERHKRFLFVDWIRALVRAIVVLRYFIVNFIRIFLSFSFCVSFCLLFLLSALSTFNFSRNASFEVGNFTIGTKIDCEESHCKRCASTLTLKTVFDGALECSPRYFPIDANSVSPCLMNIKCKYKEYIS